MSCFSVQTSLGSSCMFMFMFMLMYVFMRPASGRLAGTMVEGRWPRGPGAGVGGASQRVGHHRPAKAALAPSRCGYLKFDAVCKTAGIETACPMRAGEWAAGREQ